MCAEVGSVTKKRSRGTDEYVVFVGASNSNTGVPDFQLFRTARTEFFTRDIIMAMHLSDPSDRTALGVPGCKCDEGVDFDENVWEEIQPSDLYGAEGHVIVVGYLEE